MTMELFGPATRAWFGGSFEGPTQVQREGWPAIARGEHSLLIAPTGSGKTLAAFLWAIDKVSRLPTDAPAGVRVLYVSPLKALVYDVERNLRAPLVGIRRSGELIGHPVRPIEVSVRTGDTSQRARREMARRPGDLLVTTPESLYLLLTSQARSILATVDTIIVDEIHALAPTKRGVHLALSLERLAAMTERDPQRIGLSATARPLDVVAKALGGDREVCVIDAAAPPNLELSVHVLVPDMTRPSAHLALELSEPEPASSAVVAVDLTDDEAPDPGDDPYDDPIYGEALARMTASPEERTSIWPSIHPELIALIRSHRTTIIFTNSRGLCERLAGSINELAEEELVRAHHGSVAHEQRTEIEELLKEGKLPGLVATSSLELGIDMGTVDLVVQIESPGSVASGLQRVGRAGHGVGEISRGRIFPKHRGDLLEATVVAREMLAGAIEPLRVPRNCLDVLAQQIVAMCVDTTRTVEEIEQLVRRTYAYQDLTRTVLHSVLDMLVGRYPSSDFAELRPRLIWDREGDTLTARGDAKMIAILSGGTIPDRGLYAVYLGADGPRLGELDEEMVYEMRPGEVFILGASTWRVVDITRDRVIVSPAPGEPGRMPFWKGPALGRPIETGRALGRFVREVAALPEDEARARLAGQHHLNEHASTNLIRYLAEQREASMGALPTDRAIVIERFRDELGDYRVCILSPFGARVHAPWALALQGLLAARAGFEVQTLYSDDGIALRFATVDEDTPFTELLIPEPEEVEELVVEQLASSALFASAFRESAARALLLPRRRPGHRSPLWAQRLKAQTLLAVARQYPSFPIVLEAYRECLQDVFDVPALKRLLEAIHRREVQVIDVETQSASPFARSLVFAWVAAYLYEGDAPVAERRAQALMLDRNLLRELLGAEELRQLLDADVIAQLEEELQALADGRRARHADGLHDLLRRVGDLTAAEVDARCVGGSGAEWLAQLDKQRRAVRMRVGGAERWVAIEDVARYRDGLGAMPPAGLPQVYLERVDQALEGLVARYARTHTPFALTLITERYQLPVGPTETVLRSLVREGRLVEGELRPDGTTLEWCDAEVLRRLRRRTLALLRDQVAPVEADVLGRFLPSWHGVGAGRSGLARLEEVVAQLEGLPLSFRDLERTILPARVQGYHAGMLDELGAVGAVVWTGRSAQGETVALYRRDRVPYLVDMNEDAAPDDPLPRAILAHLEARGASFLVDIRMPGMDGGMDGGMDLLMEALWELVWAGLVTNDTFLPLRAASVTRKVGARGKRGAKVRTRAAGGRWSLVSQLIGARPSDTERAHQRALMLLERYGIVSREAALQEGLLGGFAGVYPVLAAMEESGRVRRGYFVDGLGGAQFAYPGAVDRLRAARDPAATNQVLVLAAAEPAQPYGALLPWPPLRVPGSGTPKRVIEAHVVLVDGAAVLYVERGGRRLLSFVASEDEGRLEVALGALRSITERRRNKMLTLEKIDGESARQSALARALVKAGFAPDYRGLTLMV